MDKKERIIIRIIFVTALTIILSCYVIKLCLVGNFPMEYRDAGVVKITAELARGNNPYSLESLYASSEPQVYFASGFFFTSLLAVPLVKCFSVPPTMAMYIVCFFLVVCIIALMYYLVAKYTKNQFCAAFGSLLIVSCLQRSDSLVARGDILAELCILLLIALGLDIVNVKTKSTDMWKLILCGILSGLIFWLKPQYVIVAASMFIYLTLNNYKQGLLFAIYSGVATIVMAIGIYIAFPVFFSIYLVRLGGSGPAILSNGNSNMGYSLQQFLYLFIFYLPCFWLCLIGMKRYFLLIKKAWGKQNEVKVLLGGKKTYFVINICICIIAMLQLGKHTGAFLWYHYFTLVPSMIFLAMMTFAEKESSKGRYRNMLLVAVVSLICLAPLHRYFDLWDIKQKYTSYKQAYAVLDKYQSEQMLLSNLLACYSIDHDIYNYIYGYEPSLRKIISDSKGIGWLTDYNNINFDKNQDYANMILVNMKKKKYSVIVIDQWIEPLDSVGLHDAFMECLSENYVVAEKVPVFINHQYNLTEFWIPKE